MQRISKISITNFKAYSESTVFDNQDCANLLLYGENGSGKSSFFNALKLFLKTTTQPMLSFDKNLYLNPAIDGEIEVELYDDSTDTRTTFLASSDATKNTNTARVLKDAADSFGYLDYKRVLEFYLTKEAVPELFDLVVIKLLGRYRFPGFSNTIEKTWRKIDDGLFNTRTRTTRKHKAALAELNNFNIKLSAFLPTIENRVNSYLDIFFPHMNVNIKFNYTNLKMVYRNPKFRWYIEHGLTISVVNKAIATNPNVANYKQNLNEARLSAIAICIYLAALREMPNVDFQFLLLDDVFIGIDTGNRIPILQLLQAEFSDYQVFITTYDRSWYNLVKEHYEAHVGTKWKSFELYEGYKDLAPATRIAMPVVVEGISNYAYAWLYFREPSCINYPAAANFLRKAFESLFQNMLPKFVLLNKGKNPVEGYKLKSILTLVSQFLTQCRNINPLFCEALTAIRDVQGLLYALLHPLSHSTPYIPVYKTELEILFKAYETLNRCFDNLALTTSLECFKERDMLLRLNVNGRSGWKGFYDLRLTENLYRYGGVESLTEIHAERMCLYDSSGNEKYNLQINKKSRLN